MKNLFLLVLVSFLGIQPIYSADGTDEPEDLVDDRWYTQTQLKLGKRVFERNCMVCHGYSGEGIADDWKKPLADGSYPPPPLNGTAHTWHHVRSALLRTINKGGKEWGGQMPAFADKMSEAEKLAATLSQVVDVGDRERVRALPQIVR